MINRRLLLGSLIIVLSLTSFVYAFVGPLGGKAKLVYIEELKGKDISELEKILESDADFESNKGELVLEELGNRADKQSQALLERYGQKLKKEIEKASYYKLPYTYAQVNLARIRAGGQDSNEYIDELEKLLTGKNQYIQQDIVFFELSNSLKLKAREVLLKYENEKGMSPAARFYRLRMDYLNLDDEEFVKSLLKSAREQIARGDTLLSSERSLLSERIIQCPMSPLILEEEIKQPTLNNQFYREFLSESLDRMRSSEKTYYSGFSELWKRYQKRENGLSDDLKKMYMDDTQTRYNVSYREKACEMYLIIQMEQAGLNNPQNAAKYLLSQLKGIGDSHISDYTEKGQKTMVAIEDSVKVKLLRRYGNVVLPVIDEELTKESQGQRKEALVYIKKQIELTKTE
jgi:hypothetical protein